VNSLRFSYLVSQTTDLEVAQIDAFSACIESDAVENPKAVCIDVVTEFGEFALFSNQNKADVCAEAVDKLTDLQNQASVSGKSPLDSCSFIVVQVY